MTADQTEAAMRLYRSARWRDLGALGTMAERDLWRTLTASFAGIVGKGGPGGSDDGRAMPYERAQGIPPGWWRRDR
jgi:hypothetical protein